MQHNIFDKGMFVKLHFNFNKRSNLDLLAQVVFSLFSQNEKSSYLIGFKFSSLKDVERTAIIAKIQEFEENPNAHEGYLLEITGSEDPYSSTKKVQEAYQLLNVEKRLSPRISIPLPLIVSIGNYTGNILNLSEAGICFSLKESKLSGEIALLLDFHPFSLRRVPMLTEIIWREDSGNDMFLYGARFRSLKDNDISSIRDFLFDRYAQEAIAFMRANETLKMKIQDFIREDVRKYHENLAALVMEIEGENLAVDEIQQRVDILMNWLLLKADAIESTMGNKGYAVKIRKVFRDLVGCWVYKSPILKMAFDRPRGYPGDFKLFEHIYDEGPLSVGIGHYFDKYFIDNPYSKAARSRKNKMKTILRDFIKNHPGPSVRLLNVACGGSREIRELLSESFGKDKKIFFTGLDSDKGAIEFSKASLKNFPANFEARFINESVLNLFEEKKESYKKIIGAQDIIYILGLTEYLPDRIFGKLIHFLFNLLDKKGKLVVTYKDKDKDMPFPSIPPEWLCNWSFIKRSQNDLTNIARQLGIDADSIKIEREDTGSIFFVTLVKNG